MLLFFLLSNEFCINLNHFHSFPDLKIDQKQQSVWILPSVFFDALMFVFSVLGVFVIPIMYVVDEIRLRYYVFRVQGFDGITNFKTHIIVAEIVIILWTGQLICQECLL